MKKNNKKNIFGTTEVVFLVVITCILSFTMASLICINKGKNNNILVSKDDALNKFVEQYDNILNNYYKDVDKGELIDNAIKGMIEGLDDPYATYFDEAQAKNFNIKLNGQFEGIGVEVIKLENGNIFVVNTFEGAPADVAGIEIGDEIYSLNGTSVAEISTAEFSNIVMSNKENTILVRRNDEELTFKLSKGNVVIKSATSQMLTDKIGYIKVDLFALNTYGQVKECLDSLRKNGMESLILDLRDNSGGHLSSASDILSLFLSNKRVMYQTKSDEKIEKFYSEGAEDFKGRIVILVNSNSASASEVVTASLQENLEATVLGKTTFGKGTAQRLITLSSGEQYKFTVKEWLTANGKTINGVGIKPDVEEDNENIYIDKAIELLK